MFKPFSFIINMAFIRFVKITIGGNVNLNTITLLTLMFNITNTLYRTIGIISTNYNTY